MSEKFSDAPINSNKPLEKRVGKEVLPGAPLVSVIIPAYDIAEYVAEALDSALAQTFKSFEIIVVNDGSPDTAELETALTPYFEKIVYLKQANGGAAAARNAAIAASRGSILAFLDGDDVWYAKKLEKQVDFLNSNNFEMVYCNAMLFGEPLFEGKTFMETAPSEGVVTPTSLLDGRCNVLTSGNIVRKKSVIKYGMFDEKAIRTEDFELWFRLCKNGVKIGFQTDIMLKYRIRAGSLTGNNFEKAARSIAALEVVKEKNELTDSELKVWRNKLAEFKARLSLEKGKHDLINGNFAEARRNFADANNFDQKLKLKAIMWLLAISPQLVLKLFKTLRPAEFSYITPTNSQK